MKKRRRRTNKEMWANRIIRHEGQEEEELTPTTQMD